MARTLLLERRVKTVRVGEIVADKFEVARVLGEGGMGVVVAARHLELDQLVALKFMRDEVAATGQASERFLREARAAARLRSEHVARVHDVGRLADGTPYIVMEYLEGRDLGQLLEASGPLPIADAVAYVLQACAAMAEAHAHGIVHRDLKPQNLFLAVGPDGRPLVKVLDFGISKAQLVDGTTKTQQALGTPAYMAPEQMRSARTVDGRADIWSLGVILHQLLAGTLPFSGDTFTETMLKAIIEPAPPLASLRPDVPPALAQVVERCLEKDRDRRYASVAELAHDLSPFAGLAAAAPTPFLAAPVVRPRPTTLGTAASSMSVPRKPATRWSLIAAAVGTVIVGAIVTLAATCRPASTAVDAPASPTAVIVDAEPVAIATTPVDGPRRDGSPLDGPHLDGSPLDGPRLDGARPDRPPVGRPPADRSRLDRPTDAASSGLDAARRSGRPPSPTDAGAHTPIDAPPPSEVAADAAPAPPDAYVVQDPNAPGAHW